MIAPDGDLALVSGDSVTVVTGTDGVPPVLMLFEPP